MQKPKEVTTCHPLAGARQASRLKRPCPRGKQDHPASLSPKQDNQSISDCQEGLICENEFLVLVRRRGRRHREVSGTLETVLYILCK